MVSARPRHLKVAEELLEQHRTVLHHAVRMRNPDRYRYGIRVAASLRRTSEEVAARRVSTTVGEAFVVAGAKYLEEITHARKR